MVAPNTNLIRYSGILDNPLWYNANSYSGKINGSSPTGHTYRFVAFGSEPPTYSQFIGQHGIPEYVPNKTYTLSVWVCAENWTNKRILLRLQSYVEGGGACGIGQYFYPNGNTSGPIAAAINMPATGVPSWTNITGGIEELTAGWERIWVQGTAPNLPGAKFDVALTTTPAEGIGDIGSTFLLGGFALDQGTNTAFAETTTAPRGNDFLPVFDFPFHVIESRYPVTGLQVQFGNSYTFSSRASGPPQRSFSLEFPAMSWFLDAFTEQVDPTQQPQRNLAALDAFYRLVELSGSFHYPHPMFGMLVCKFLRPLTLPKQLPGGAGVVAPMTIDLIEIP